MAGQPASTGARAASKAAAMCTLRAGPGDDQRFRHEAPPVTG